MTQDANEKLTELAACPCCGPAKDEALGPTVVTRWNEVGRRVCCVVCRLCGLKTKDFDDSYTCNHAIAAWNRRTPSPAPASAEVEERLAKIEELLLLAAEIGSVVAAGASYEMRTKHVPWLVALVRRLSERGTADPQNCEYPHCSCDAKPPRDQQTPRRV
jgi:hypothetical protein